MKLSLSTVVKYRRLKTFVYLLKLNICYTLTTKHILQQKLSNSSSNICSDKADLWMQTSVSRPQIDGIDFILMEDDGIVEMWKRKTSV